MLEVQNVSVSYGDFDAVRGLSFSLKEGQWLMLAGPNGAGKSTILRAITQGAAYSGSILLGGRDIRRIAPAERARRIGMLEQHHRVGYAYTVGEIVELGRYAHARGFLSRRSDGREAVERALEVTGMTHLRDKNVLTLSGGELQRAFLAQVFAQEPDILLLDEPANHLDLVYQKQIFALIAEWLKTPGRAVLSVVHDLSLARHCGTHAVLLHEGRCAARGRMEDVMTDENLRAVYGMNVGAYLRELAAVWGNAPRDADI